ncbi:MAG: hypothetical protein WBQ04_08255, partial [Candidatus Acidiferrales bacterium]
IKGDVNKKASPSAGSREIFCLDIQPTICRWLSLSQIATNRSSLKELVDSNPAKNSPTISKREYLSSVRRPKSENSLKSTLEVHENFEKLSSELSGEALLKFRIAIILAVE